MWLGESVRHPECTRHELFETTRHNAPPCMRPWFEAARNYTMFANDGAIYDDLRSYIRANTLI